VRAGATAFPFLLLPDVRAKLASKQTAIACDFRRKEERRMERGCSSLDEGQLSQAMATALLMLARLLATPANRAALAIAPTSTSTSTCTYQ